MERNKRRLQVGSLVVALSPGDKLFFGTGGHREPPYSVNTMVALRDARAIAIIDRGFSPIN
jgi:hypothetical protein